MAINYPTFSNSMALQNLPKLWFLVWKYTIWQPWWAENSAENRGSWVRTPAQSSHGSLLETENIFLVEKGSTIWIFKYFRQKKLAIFSQISAIYIGRKNVHYIFL
jgi:hypothetical protein